VRGRAQAFPGLFGHSERLSTYTLEPGRHPGCLGQVHRCHEDLYMAVAKQENRERGFLLGKQGMDRSTENRLCVSGGGLFPAYGKEARGRALLPTICEPPSHWI